MTLGAGPGSTPTRIDFRNVRRGEFAALRAFFESYFGPGYFEVEPKQFHWMHRDSPAVGRVAADDEFSALGVFRGAEIVGSLLYYPADIFVDGSRFPSSITTGILVKPEFSGLAGLLLRRHFAGNSYHLSMGDTELMRGLYVNQFGCEYEHNIGRVVMVGAMDETLRLLERRAPVAAEQQQRVQSWADATAKSAATGDFVRIKCASQLSDEYWVDHRRSCRATVARDQMFMKWRYFDHPNLTYDVISPTVGQESGIAAVRIERVRGQGVSVARLLDFLPTQGGAERLAGAVACYLVQSRAAFLDFFCGSRRFLEERLPPPFLLERDHASLHFPRLFQPLEWRERLSINATFGCVRRKGGAPEAALDEVYFTKADACQDVFVNEEYSTKGF